MGESGSRTPRFVARPAQPEPVAGSVQGQELVQYDLTPEQYHALIRLTAALATVLPRIRCDYPRDADGKLVTRKLPDAELETFRGILGHYQIQLNKVDPGPAFQWDKVTEGAQRLMRAARRDPLAKGAVRLLEP